MRTPQRMTLAEFREAIRQFLNVRCLQCDKTLVCTRCEAPIAYLQALLSIHDDAFADACVSLQDEEWHFAVPYCPRCELKPDAHGCVHLPHTQSQRVA
jgi:hypothetical protein